MDYNTTLDFLRKEAGSKYDDSVMLLRRLLGISDDVPHPAKASKVSQRTSAVLQLVKSGKKLKDPRDIELVKNLLKRTTGIDYKYSRSAGVFLPTPLANAVASKRVTMRQAVAIHKHSYVNGKFSAAHMNKGLQKAVSVPTTPTSPQPTPIVPKDSPQSGKVVKPNNVVKPSATGAPSDLLPTDTSSTPSPKIPNVRSNLVKLLSGRYFNQYGVPDQAKLPSGVKPTAVRSLYAKLIDTSNPRLTDEEIKLLNRLGQSEDFKHTNWGSKLFNKNQAPREYVSGSNGKIHVSGGGLSPVEGSRYLQQRNGADGIPLVYPQVKLVRPIEEANRRMKQVFDALGLPGYESIKLPPSTPPTKLTNRKRRAHMQALRNSQSLQQVGQQQVGQQIVRWQPSADPYHRNLQNTLNNADPQSINAGAAARNNPRTPLGFTVDDLTNPENRAINPPQRVVTTGVHRVVDAGADGGNATNRGFGKGRFQQSVWPENKSQVPLAEVVGQEAAQWWRNFFNRVRVKTSPKRFWKKIKGQYYAHPLSTGVKVGLGAGAGLLSGADLLAPYGKPVQEYSKGPDGKQPFQPLPATTNTGNPNANTNTPDYDSGWWRGGGALGGAIFAPWLVSALLPKNMQGGLLDTVLSLGAMAGGAYGGYHLGDWAYNKWGKK